jgi:hypothetical protein
VIDGDSFAHRAYHALPKTIHRRRDGRPVRLLSPDGPRGALEFGVASSSGFAGLEIGVGLVDMAGNQLFVADGFHREHEPGAQAVGDPVLGGDGERGDLDPTVDSAGPERERALAGAVDALEDREVGEDFAIQVAAVEIVRDRLGVAILIPAIGDEALDRPESHAADALGKRRGVVRASFLGEGGDEDEDEGEG